MSLRLFSKITNKNGISISSLALRCLRTECLEQTAHEFLNSSQSSFEQLLTDSKLIMFGRPDNKCVVGKIISICNDDLYVDYGAKHEAVVKMSIHQSVLKELAHIKVEDYYKEGVFVRLLLRSYEMTGVFLGDTTHITVCESDAILLGPYLREGLDKLK